MAESHIARAKLKSLSRDELFELLQIVKKWKWQDVRLFINLGIPKQIYYEFFNWYSKARLTTD